MKHKFNKNLMFNYTKNRRKSLDSRLKKNRGFLVTLHLILMLLFYHIIYNIILRIIQYNKNYVYEN